MDQFPVIEHLCHAPHQVLLLVLILGCAGFVSGMIGFGFGMVGASVLWILPPREGIPLLMLLSACSQIISLIQLRSSMTPLRAWWAEGPAPCILGGFAGVPIGIWLLSRLNASLTDSIIGLVIVGCATWMTMRSFMTISNPLKRTLRGIECRKIAARRHGVFGIALSRIPNKDCKFLLSGRRKRTLFYVESIFRYR